MKPAVLLVFAGVELATAIAPLPLPPPIATPASCPPSSSVAVRQIRGQIGIALPSGVRLTVVTTVAEDLCCAGNGAPRPGSWQQCPAIWLHSASAAISRTTVRRIAASAGSPSSAAAHSATCSAVSIPKRADAMDQDGRRLLPNFAKSSIIHP